MIRGKRTYTIDEAQKKLEHYCAYQERCHKEVVEKLRGMGMIPLAIDTIIADLIANNYLNEERFSKAFARGKFNVKGWGRNRITNELKYRNISKFNIDIALKEIDDEHYLQKLHELSEKRLKQIKETDKQKKRKKLANYLLYRGWESHLVYEKISNLIP